MSEFTERLRDTADTRFIILKMYGSSGNVSEEFLNDVEKAADIIDELERALREARVYVPEHHGPIVHKIESALAKLERAGS